MDSLDNVLSEIDALLDSYPNKNPLSESEGVGKDLSFCGKVEEGERETRKRLHRTGEIDIDMVELDDLVRSVEVEFASVNSINNALLDSETRAQREIQQTQLHQQRQPIARQISTSHSVKDEDVDFILESLQEELLHQEEEYLSDLVNEGAADIMRDSQTRLRKCQEVYLGSKNELRGASSSVEPRCVSVDCKCDTQTLDGMITEIVSLLPGAAMLCDAQSATSESCTSMITLGIRAPIIYSFAITILKRWNRN